MFNYNCNNSVTDNLLLILEFNANRLKNHAHELESALNSNKHIISFISETHFTKHSYIPNPGYNLIKTNHPDNTAHGGTAIFVKSTIEYYPLPTFSQAFIQPCAINLKTNNTPLTTAAIYSPPPPNIISLTYNSPTT